MSRLSLKPKILDWYIIKKFITTYLMALLIVTAIVIIFDISEKIDDFVEKEAPLHEIIFEYYCNFIPFILNMFSPLFVFITVIFFTSKLANNSEIVAMLAGGISFQRLLVPYMVSAAFAALLSLALGMYVIPPANFHRLEFEQKYVKGTRFFNTNHNIHYQLAPGLFVYVESFSSWNNSVNRFTLETIEDNKLVSKLTAASAVWKEEEGCWECKNCFVRSYDEHGNETIQTFAKKDTAIALTIDDFYRRKNVVESLKIKDLDELIEMQNMRGDKMVVHALIEKHTRIATPFSAFILTLMGVALCSRKRRGGLGINIGIGVALSFSYILFMRFSQMFVHTGALPPWLAIWLPNIIYTFIALFVYRMAPK
ncbi:MAG: LptF/LptG family permease [Bacteroidales bacterium]|nr:LptF/LptG family permease [Bacteroidales bacterium]